MVFFKSVIFLVSCVVVLSGCAEGLLKQQTGREIILDKPVELRMRGSTGRKEVNKFYTRSITKTFEEGQIRHEKEEDMSFTTEAVLLSVDSKTGDLTYTVAVTEKDGMMSLHDMAFPEMGENLEMEYSPEAKVVKAGAFPTNSIFYMPPVSFPSHPVKKGDTWTMQSEWVSMNNSLPLRLDLVSILKKFISCGEHVCADIEVSGEVKFASQISNGPVFSSQMNGNIYVSLDSGSVVWSTVNSQEKLILPPTTEVEVRSCLNNFLLNPSDEKLAGIEKAKCDL